MRETLKTPLPLLYEIVMASDNALCGHSIDNLFKACDIGTDSIIAFFRYKNCFGIPKSKTASLSTYTQRRLCLYALHYTPTKKLCQPLFETFFAKSLQKESEFSHTLLTKCKSESIIMANEQRRSFQCRRNSTLR